MKLAQLVQQSQKTIINQNEFFSMMATEWKQGEHFSIVGPTGAGKTWVAADALRLRTFVVVVTTKVKDRTLERYGTFTTFKKWEQVPLDVSRVLLRPVSKDLITAAPVAQKEVFSLLTDAYKSGGWTIYIDDTYFVSETLKLRPWLQMMMTQARSNNVTLVNSLQRPAWVPLEVLSQSTHVLLFRMNDGRDIDRVAEATGMDRKKVRELMNTLREYEFIYIRNGLFAIPIRKDEL